MSNEERRRPETLSSAAQLTLEEAVGEFRAELEARTQVIASSQGTVSRQATARDVTEAFNQIMRDAADPAGREADRERYMRFLWTLTGTYFVLGAIILSVSLWGKRLEFADYAVTGAGVLMGTIITMGLLQLQSPILRLITPRKVSGQAQGPAVTRASLIVLWLEIERTMRDRLSEEIGESRVSDDPRVLIDQFSRAANLSSSDAEDLSFTLQTRNRTAHMREVESSDIDKAVHTAGRLLTKFKSVNLSVRE